MKKTADLQDFYESKFNWMPPNLQKEVGHFNVFRRSDFVNKDSKQIPYNRRDYYKISLLEGKVRIHYADKTVESEKYALMFADPMIPYSYEYLEEQQSGVFCVFTEAFFNQFGAIKEYPIYQPGHNKVFILTPEKKAEIEAIFQKMIDEIATDYTYKYDILRNLVFELIHSAQKMEPAAQTLFNGSNAATRISSLFTELLERQFPIESPMQRMRLRAPADFSAQLAVHINHLNRSLKQVTGKTTSQLIAERVSSEAGALLKHTNWNISEIAYCLGFEESPHFIHFFKKHFQQTPRAFRLNTNV